MFLRFRAPETMTASEQALLLQETAAQADLRDHILYSTTLGTGLRLKELLGLNVGDVSPNGEQVRQRIVLKVTKGNRRNAPLTVCGRLSSPSVRRSFLRVTG